MILYMIKGHLTCDISNFIILSIKFIKAVYSKFYLLVYPNLINWINASFDTTFKQSVADPNT